MRRSIDHEIRSTQAIRFRVILKYGDCSYAAESADPSTTSSGNDQEKKERKESLIDKETYISMKTD
jgi:hypothetical protein